jgi:hypothetical protein
MHDLLRERLSADQPAPDSSVIPGSKLIARAAEALTAAVQVPFTLPAQSRSNMERSGDGKIASGR